MDHFYEIPGYPKGVSATSILTRLLDGLGFRFHWATEGLRQEGYAFRPAEDVMSVTELIRHIWGLINWVGISVLGRSHKRPEEVEAIRNQILEIIWELREAVQSMGEEDLGKVTIEGRPFWHIINGPISDALTHTGQVNSFRRLSGNPVYGANVFTGTPPKK